MGAPRLPFFLAMEEWVAMQLPAGEYFFTWIVSPTVIIGRNQDLGTEVNLEYCQAHGIDVCRRRSGGGCVYADTNNIMMSYICPGTDVESIFRRYAQMVAGQLRAIGLDADVSGRNDITVDGHKISGNAFYHLPERSIVHGTMLFDADTATMYNAITPSRAKLESNKVNSVESRITMARKYLPGWDVNRFRDALVAGLTTGTLMVDEKSLAAIRELEARYYKPEWVLRGASGGAAGRMKRIRGVGELSVTSQLDADGLIRQVSVTGDAFVVRGEELSALLRGCQPDAAKLSLRLSGVDVSQYIVGLDSARLVELLLENVVPQTQ